MENSLALVEVMSTYDSWRCLLIPGGVFLLDPSDILHGARFNLSSYMVFIVVRENQGCVVFIATKTDFIQDFII